MSGEERTVVVCPECGTPAGATLNRRDAQDFCAKCDFPLFWTPSEVIRDGGEGNTEGLRRLPGTAGRVTVASVPCPTCAEANPLGAQNCLRCGGPMVLAVPEPLPAPAPAPLPAPEPVAPEPAGQWWLIAAAALVAVVILIVVLLVR